MFPPTWGLIEILDSEDKPVEPGVMGQVVCTGLQNTLQPLIRYRVGDVARWATDQTCPCKRSMPILEAIEGRFEDICVTPDGREMLRFDTVFKGVETIREAQVVQETLDLFRIYVVPTEQFGEHDVEVNPTQHAAARRERANGCKDGRFNSTQLVGQI